MPLIKETPLLFLVLFEIFLGSCTWILSAKVSFLTSSITKVSVGFTKFHNRRLLYVFARQLHSSSLVFLHQWFSAKPWRRKARVPQQTPLIIRGTIHIELKKSHNSSFRTITGWTSRVIQPVPVHSVIQPVPVHNNPQQVHSSPWLPVGSRGATKARGDFQRDREQRNGTSTCPLSVPFRAQTYRK